MVVPPSGGVGYRARPPGRPLWTDLVSILIQPILTWRSTVDSGSCRIVACYSFEFRCRIGRELWAPWHQH